MSLEPSSYREIQSWNRMPQGAFVRDLSFIKGKLSSSVLRGGNADSAQSKVGKHDWAIFLSTGTVPFLRLIYWNSTTCAGPLKFISKKEAKQHLGFLKEQSNHYAAYVASIRLTAIWFCLLVIAKQTQGESSVALMRQKLCSNSEDISFASKLWQVFRAVITGALDELKAVLGDAVTLVMETIDVRIQCLFVQVLQLDRDICAVTLARFTGEKGADISSQNIFWTTR
jgi:hypothetical protein